MDFFQYWFMLPVAICVATCAMLSGIGGAALFTPIFVLVFPLLGPEYVLESTVAAIAVALITQTFGFASGLVGYYRRRLIDYDLGWRLIRIAVPIAILGVWSANHLPDFVLLASYAALVLVLAWSLWRRNRRADIAHSGPARRQRVIVDSRGERYEYSDPRLSPASIMLTGLGAYMTGLVSVGMGEVTISQLNHKAVPIAVAAATSVLVVSITVLFASSMHVLQIVQAGGWAAIPWNLLVWDVPGVLIGGQIGPRLQGLVAQKTMQRSIAILFVALAVAMMFVAKQKAGIELPA